MLFVKGFHLTGDCVHQDGPHTDRLTGEHHTQDRITQHVTPKALPLPSPVNGKPAEQHNRHRIRHVAADAPGCRAGEHRASGRAVVANYAPAGTQDERARTALGFIVAGVALQLIVERLDPGAEFIEFMI